MKKENLKNLRIAVKCMRIVSQELTEARKKFMKINSDQLNKESWERICEIDDAIDELQGYINGEEHGSL